MTQIKGFEVWDDEFDRRHFTPAEIAESDLKVALITALVQAQLDRDSVTSSI
ncbi:MAG: hypothetical protein IJ520_00135 [Synergistaceae bacterium]|nr:hypothetical protein [Synergistaceae bacterium]